MTILSNPFTNLSNGDGFRAEARTLAVAAGLLERLHADGYTASGAKLNKLVYLAHAYSLGAYARPLLLEPVQALDHGPLIATLHRKTVEQLEQLDRPMKRVPGAPKRFDFDKQEQHVMDVTCRAHAHRSALELTAMVDRMGSAWQITWSKAVADKRDAFSASIPNDLIERQYRALLSKSEHAHLFRSEPLSTQPTQPKANAADAARIDFTQADVPVDRVELTLSAEACLAADYSQADLSQAMFICHRIAQARAFALPQNGGSGQIAWDHFESIAADAERLLAAQCITALDEEAREANGVAEDEVPVPAAPCG